MLTIKKVILILLITLSLIISFISQYHSLINTFKDTATLTEKRLNEHIHINNNFIEDMALYGNSFFEQGGGKDSELIHLLTYNPASTSYNLDTIRGTNYEKVVGNLTGTGRIPDSGIDRDEINLALRYNKFFHNHYGKYPEVAWLYYTSEHNFINVYPWVPSKEFAFSEQLKTRDSHKMAEPKNNPLRKSVWTSAYVDLAGKGLMVTLSAPIYNKDTFKGIVSLDLTNRQLTNIIASKYEGYLFDKTDTILATNHPNESSSSAKKLKETLHISTSESEKIKSLKKNTVQRVGGSYIYISHFDEAPWHLLVRVPIWHVVGKAIVFTLPILLMNILFLLAMNQITKRKKSEALLNKKRNLLETTLFSINEGIIVTDQSGKITMMNMLGEKYTGWSKEEAYGQDFHTVFHNIHPMTKEKGPNPVKLVLESGESSTSKTYNALLSKDGSEMYILGTAAPIISNNREITGIIVSFRDITKQYEQEHEIEGFLNLNLEMFCVADIEGNFHKVNKRFEETLGYKAKELEGKSVFKFLHEKDTQATLDAIEDIIKNNTLTSFTNRFRCKNGTYKYIEWHSQRSIGKYTYSSARDVTEKILAEREMKNLAIKDQLTGLYNRHFLDMIIDKEMTVSDHNNRPLSMVILDLDRFKKVNDTWGHPVGDALLKHTCQTTTSTIRNSDILVRFGGEEFIILMPQTTADEAANIAEKVRIAIETNSHPITGKQTASFGVAQRKPNESFENWYQRLDEALYQAKETGRNRVVAAE